MSHFYGSIKGTRGEATRCGDKHSGYNAYAASWSGAIHVHLYHDRETGKDHYIVSQETWGGSGVQETLATGVLGEKSPTAQLTDRLEQAAIEASLV